MIYIIIPTYNRKAISFTCLTNLSRQTNKKFITIVIDDNSTDGTSEMIQNNFPAMILLKGNGNLFWTGATALGVDYVLKHAQSADYILTLNDDTNVNEDYVENLYQSISLFPNTIIGSTIVDDSDKNSVHDCGLRVNWLTAKYTAVKGIKLNELKEAIVFPTDFICGNGTLLPVALFMEAGNYNVKKLPHYAADYEITARARKFGYRILLYSKNIVYSKISETGFDNSARKLSMRQFFSSYFSKKSPNALKYRFNFALLVCPRKYLVTFVFLDFCRVFWGALIRQLFSSP